MPSKIDDGLTANQRYYRKHNGAERSRQDVAKWREANPERAREIDRASYARTAEKRREEKRRYYQEVVKERNRTPEGRLKEAMRKARRRALAAGLPATLTVDEWEAILGRFNHSCAYCGTTGEMEQDHVIPLSKGGPYTADNIVPACKSCNSSKGNRWTEQ